MTCILSLVKPPMTVNESSFVNASDAVLFIMQLPWSRDLRPQKMPLFTHHAGMDCGLLNVPGDTSHKSISVLKVGIKICLVEKTRMNLHLGVNILLYKHIKI